MMERQLIRGSLGLLFTFALAVPVGGGRVLAGDVFNLDASALTSAAGIGTDGRPSGAKWAAKLTLGLDTLAIEYEAYQFNVERGAVPPGSFETQATMAPLVAEKVLVDAVATDDPLALKSALETLGAEVKAVAGRVMSALVPLSALRELETIESLKFARPALSSTRAGSVTSQGDRAQYSDYARTNFDVTGLGQIVGVLSDSFDCSGNGSYAADEASGDLPADVIVLDDSACPGTDEGRAMAQIVHDVAPGAHIAFHTAFNGEAAFAQGIRDLAAAGASIIVDDVWYFAEPMFQDGVIAQSVDDVTALGVSYFSSAGNSARNSYESPFRPSGAFLDLGDGPQQLHDFDPGPAIDTWQQFRFSGDRVPFILQWGPILL